MLRFPCPSCGFALSAPVEAAGRTSRCRSCKQPVTVPAPVVLQPAPGPAQPRPRPAPKRVKPALLAGSAAAALLAVGAVLFAVVWSGRAPPGARAVLDPESHPVLADPYWDGGRLAPENLDRMVRLVQAGGGYVFLDPSGRSALVRRDPNGDPLRRRDNHPLEIHALARIANREVESFSARAVCVPTSAGCSRSRALAAIRAAVRGPTYADLHRENDENHRRTFEGLKDLKDVPLVELPPVETGGLGGLKMLKKP